MNWSYAIITGEFYLCYRLHVILTGGYRKLEVGPYLPNALRLNLQVFSTIQTLFPMDYIPVYEEF